MAIFYPSQFTALSALLFRNPGDNSMNMILKKASLARVFSGCLESDHVQAFMMNGITLLLNQPACGKTNRSITTKQKQIKCFLV